MGIVDWINLVENRNGWWGAEHSGCVRCGKCLD